MCALLFSWLMSFYSVLAQGREATAPSSSVSSAQVQNGEDATRPKLDWRRHLQSQSGLSPVGTADDGGTLWLITHAGPGKRKEYVTNVDPEGNVIGNYDLQLPLNPAEWVSDLSPATSGHSAGLLASLASGGQQQPFEGAFFLSLGRGGVGAPRRVAGRGPQFPTLVGAGSDEFIAAGDQAPLTVLKLDSEGTVIWRRSFSRRLVLPTIAVSADRKILVVSQGGTYVQLQVLDESGHPLMSKRIAARQATVAADSDGRWTVLLSKGTGGKENRVYLAVLDPMLRQVSQVETPLRGRRGRTYQLISTPDGHLIVGESPDEGRQIMAEFDRSETLMWQREITDDLTPLLVPFRGGFYVVKDSAEGEGMNIEKYVY